MNSTPQPSPGYPTPRPVHAVCLDWIRIILSLGSVFGQLVCLGGCATSTGSDLTPPPGATRTAVSGDWDDIDAAVLAGTNKAEFVVAAWWWADPDTRVYSLRNAHGTSGTLRLHRNPDNPGEAISIAAWIGPFGDAAAEREVIAKVRQRLEQLRGVDAAPIK